MAIDPFSDILRLADARTVVSGSLAAGGPWAIRFPAPDRLKFFGVVRGVCWFRLDDEGPPVRLGEGDVLLLSLALRRGFVLADDPSTVAVDVASVYVPGSGPMMTLGAGDEFLMLGGHVRVDPWSGGLLAGALPPMIHVRAGSPRASVLHWLLDQLVREGEADQPGAGVASAQLAQLVFVQLLRAHLEDSGPLPAGWLRAVGDRRLVPALRLMHGDPGRRWRLDELARAASMSRTTFAEHFREAAGVAPLAYLTEWRMRLAERALRDDDATVAALARSLGYASESAFSNAFKRVTGRSPRSCRDATRSAFGESARSDPSVALDPATVGLA